MRREEDISSGIDLRVNVKWLEVGAGPQILSTGPFAGVAERPRKKKKKKKKTRSSKFFLAPLASRRYLFGPQSDCRIEAKRHGYSFLVEHNFSLYIFRTFPTWRPRRRYLHLCCIVTNLNKNRGAEISWLDWGRLADR
jgi:hypothetical protein